ncbi:MAG: glycosyltransferase family 2 protein [Pseudomonadota bacterium]|nr:glycosyltransferase family 2 protein [Pseudomonadota bacterium]
MVKHITPDQHSLAQAATDASDAPTVSILIVAYNSAALIERCISAIAPACRKQSFEVLLVDNGDGSTEALVTERFPEVRIIPTRGNIGFAAGNNWLAEHARSDYLLLLNPDMVLFENAIDALFEGVAAHPNAGAWGGISVDSDGTPNSGNAIPIPSLGEFASRAMGRSREEGLPPERLLNDAQVNVLMGGFMMLPRKAWAEVAGLDERYFLYCEEVDLLHRLESKGYTFWRIAGARGEHEAFHGQSHSPMRALYSTAGKVEFMRAHWSTPRRYLGTALLWLGTFERFLAGKLLGSSRPNLAKRADASRYVALQPSLWMNGYHPTKGLMAQLTRRGGSLS